MARYWEALRTEPRPHGTSGCLMKVWLAVVVLDLFMLLTFGISDIVLGQTFFALGMLASTSAELLPKHRLDLAAILRLLAFSLIAIALVLALGSLWRRPFMSTIEKAALLAGFSLLGSLLWMLKRRRS